MRKTETKHKDSTLSLLAVHVITECDSVSEMSGIGKEKVLNII